MKRRRQLSLSRIALGFFAGLTLSAEVPRARDEQVRRQIEAELHETLDRVVDERGFAERLGFAYPVQAPALPYAKLKEMADTYADKAINEKYPETWVEEEFARRHRQRFGPWRVGTTVTVMLKNGTRFTERIRAIDQYSITIGPKEIHKSDLHEDSLVHLDTTVAANEIKLIKMKLTSLHQRLVAELRQKTARGFWNKEGYILVEDKWTSKYQVFRDRVDERRERLTRLLLPALEDKHYYLAGFRKYKEEWYEPAGAADRKASDPEEVGQIKAFFHNLLSGRPWHVALVAGGAVTLIALIMACFAARARRRR